MNFGGTIRVNRIGFCIICCVIILFILYLSPQRTSNVGPKVLNLKSILLSSIEAAEKGGFEVIKSLDNLKEEIKGKTKEGVKIPVTIADYNSHCVMFYGLSEMFPMLKIISEEKRDKKECENNIPFNGDISSRLNLVDLPEEQVDGSKISIWIDPLDATKEYTEKLLQYVTTMVCVAYDGRPIIGVIHKPFGKEPKTYWGWVNKGSSFLDNRIKESKEPNTVVVSRSHGGNVADKIEKIFGPDAKIITAGGSGYKSLEVAVGNVSSYVHVTEISKWDICAGDAIITSLGGRFTDLNGKEIDYSAETDHMSRQGVIAASIKKYEEFVKNQT